MSNESIVPVAENEPFSGTETFPLADFLSLDAPMKEVVLHLLTPEDLGSLELVSRRVRDVIRSKGLWEAPVKRFVESDTINRQLFAKCIAGRDDEDAADVCKGGGDVVEIADSRDYRKLFYQIRENKRRLDENIRQGYRKEHTVSLRSDLKRKDMDCQSTDVGDFVFIAYDYRVEVLQVAVKREGSTLERTSRYDIDFSGKFEEYAGLAFDPSYIHGIRCHGDLLFIFHQSGAVSVWTWKDGSLVHNVTHHAIPKEILQKLERASLAEWVFRNTTLTAMECKQNKLMLAAYRPVDQWASGPVDTQILNNEPVTVWKFSGTKPFSITLDDQIDFSQHGVISAINFDDYLAAFAFRSRSNFMSFRIGLWDLETKSFTRLIDSPDSRFNNLTIPRHYCVDYITLHAGSNRLMIRPFCQEPKMYSLQDGKAKELLSYDIYDVRVCAGMARAITWDWKSDKMFVGCTNGAFALYNLNDPKLITCNVFHRIIANVPVTAIHFLGSRAYLVFVQGQKLGLFDFLELSP